jgi:hypothetical protein
MKTFIIAFMFITATIFPILFIPLWVLTVAIGLLVYPYVTTHIKWYASKREIEM